MGRYDKASLERIIERGNWIESTLARDLLVLLPKKVAPTPEPTKGPLCGHEQREIIPRFPCPFPGCEAGTPAQEVIRAVEGSNDDRRYRRVKYRHASNLARTQGLSLDQWAWEMINV